MSNLALSPSSKTLAVGPGARWLAVYQLLDPLSLTVIGGRLGTVGVSGLLLGGGISFFSGRYGYGCDNVLEYEVVLASGEAVTASPERHSDLYWALRGGGGSNFGLVTKFTLAVYPQGNIWGGQRLFSERLNASLLNAVSNVAARQPQNKDVHVIQVLGYAKSLGDWIAISYLYNARGEAYPSIFAEYKALPSVTDTLRVTNISALVTEISAGSDNGKRELFRTFTVKNDPELLQEIYKICKARFDPLKDKADLVTCNFQPLPLNYVQNMQVRGGNALGIKPEDAAGKGLMVINFGVEWSQEADDAALTKAIQAVVREGTTAARRKGLDFRFVYMNYAGPEQDVYGGYGRDSVRRLREVRDRYDPEGFWKKRWPGYFKLP